MKRSLLFLIAVLAAIHSSLAGPTNSILFVTQVPIPGDFTTIGSVFGNHQATLDSAGRGGDLYIRYPDGTVKNLTRAAGYGLYGSQDTNGIAVRQPSVHWSGTKAIFSMAVGAPKKQYDYNSVSYWQLYEITNFTDPATTPVITKIPNQPSTYNNISPIYGTDDKIIFTSDRPRNGLRHLYPQLDEYEEAPTVSGLWNLDPVTGKLFLMTHTPSGAFSPIIDSGGRVVFSRWDHLQRDQQADTDALQGSVTYGTFNWSDESPSSITTTSQAEVFPEPRSSRTDLLAGTVLTGHSFNQFFPWQINEDGTEEETLNHVGRHELGGSYRNRAITNDVNIQDLYYFGGNYNTNTIDNILHISEDPRTQGMFYGIDCPEFGTHCAGQIVSLVGGTNVNASQMKVGYITSLSTRSYAQSLATIPPDHTGLYRNPIMTTDGYLIASHTTNALYESGGGSSSYPKSQYDFRLKFIQPNGAYYAAAAPLTSGLTNRATYWTPDILVSQTNLLWELDPVEVVARVRPAKIQPKLAAPEIAAFAAANVGVSDFQNYLATHDLALIVSRDVTTRDKADKLQPYNLKIAGTTHKTIGSTGKIYDISSMQIFQADQLRSINYGNVNSPRAGRRVLAQELHDPAVDNPAAVAGLLGGVKLGADGSMAAIVPARRALTWQLTDPNNAGVVRERYWLTFQPGEIRTCASCHGVNTIDQANHVPPTNTPAALVDLLNYWKTNSVTTPTVVQNQGAATFQVSFKRRPLEPGVTYHVQASTDLAAWSDIASYNSTNIIVTAQATEVSKLGAPNETVTVQDKLAMANNQKRFLRVYVTKP